MQKPGNLVRVPTSHVPGNYLGKASTLTGRQQPMPSSDDVEIGIDDGGSVYFMLYLGAESTIPRHLSCILKDSRCSSQSQMPWDHHGYPQLIIIRVIIRIGYSSYEPAEHRTFSPARLCSLDTATSCCTDFLGINGCWPPSV